jgi:hypothetical protein
MIKQKIAKKGRKRDQLTASEKIEKLCKYFGQDLRLTVLSAE